MHVICMGKMYVLQITVYVATHIRCLYTEEEWLIIERTMPQQYSLQDISQSRSCLNSSLRRMELGGCNVVCKSVRTPWWVSITAHRSIHPYIINIIQGVFYFTCPAEHPPVMTRFEHGGSDHVSQCGHLMAMKQCQRTHFLYNTASCRAMRDTKLCYILRN
jgi:hypothetical protein